MIKIELPDPVTEGERFSFVASAPTTVFQGDRRVASVNRGAFGEFEARPDGTYAPDLVLAWFVR